jgi:60 kDa SS-A/Ro ribonucleoprotein
MADALEQIRTRGAVTPQARQADPRQELNHAGGYVFTTDSETRLRRFLTMGTYGTYYVNEQDTTAEMAPFLLGWARDNATRLTELATEISVAGRAPRQGPALLALMAAMALGDVDGRRAAERAFNDVVRTGTHLFGAAKYTEQFRGWGPVARRAFAGWYLGKDPAALAYQLVKYRQRDGWTHLDVLRSAHSTKHADQPHRDLFNWLAKGVTEQGELPAMVQAHEMARDIERESGSALARRAKTAAYTQLLRDHPGLPWEALPDEATSQGDVWRVLIDNGMPVTALIRNLPKLTRLGVLAPMSAHLTAVCARLRDGELLRKGRVHPIALLVAARVYASGRSEKGSTTWVPVPQVTDALTDAFYLAFGAVEPSGRRVNLAVDISGSMASSAAGYCITARELAAAMALVTAATEPQSVITAFTHGPYESKWSGVNGMGSGITPMPVSPRQRIDDVMRTAAAMQMGGTNCAVPMLEAAKYRVPVDVFVEFTDSETWYGDIHPYQALEHYRQVMGIDARLQVVAFTPTRFSIAVPGDPRTLDVSGFDASVPVLLADHAAGRI